jgi:murein DD-endopeptidase MepM/ murein hydrolase activator NlpD
LGTFAQDTPQGVTLHIVQRGDSLYKLSRQYNVTIEAIVTLNALENPNVLKVGQRLLIPSLVATVAPTPTLPIFHTVASGETLFRIAQRYGVVLTALAQANGIVDPSLIYAGQRLLIPTTSASTPATQALYPSPIVQIALQPTFFTEGRTGLVRVVTDVPATLTLIAFDRTLKPVNPTPLQHLFFVGVPVFTPSGSTILRLKFADGQEFDISVPVVSGGYLTTNINVSPEQQALLSPAVEQFELSLLQELTQRFNATMYHRGIFSLPAASPMNAPFGTRRSYNGGDVTRYHNGADFASAPGTPVYAAATGTVVLVDVLNIRGNTIVIEHGAGVYTLYAHLASIGVSLGQQVSMGQVIGTSGSTGRVTGPHLHWEVWVNGVAVDPIEWTQTVFLADQ